MTRFAKPSGVLPFRNAEERVDLTDAALLSDFFSNVRVDTGTGCWMWTGELYANGYGCYVAHQHGRRFRVQAHRLAYRLVHGRVPEGLCVDHRCRVRACVNAGAHHEAVTIAENTRRGNIPWAVMQRTNRCKRGHDLTDPENVYVRPSGWRNCRPCRREYKRSRRRGRSVAPGSIKEQRAA